MWAAHCSNHGSVSRDIVWNQAFSNPVVLQEEQRCYTEKWSIKQAILSFGGVRWYTQKLHLLKSYIYNSYINFISNNFCSCTYFQEFVNVSLNSKKNIGSYNLTGLWDSTDYSVAIRCVNNESAFWSGWSGEKTESTEEKGKLPICKSVLLFYFEALGFSRKKTVLWCIILYWT